jgi:hypothetical protein
MVVVEPQGETPKCSKAKWSTVLSKSASRSGEPSGKPSPRRERAYGDISKIEKAFATAREKAKRPGARGVWVHPLRLKSGEHDLWFTEGSAGSQWQGMIFVKTADGRKLGSVKNGKFTRRFGCTDADETAVLNACSDPLKAAIAYGKAWSVCAVCGRELTNDGSIERGIGPGCASKFGRGPHDLAHGLTWLAMKAFLKAARIRGIG